MSVIARARRARVTRARVLAVGVVVLGLLAIVGLRPQESSAVTVEGHTGWSVIRCKFKGDNSEPFPTQYYEQMFTNRGLNLHSAYAYFVDQSQGRIDLAGTVVTNWFTMDVTLADSLKYNGQSGARGRRIDDCVAAAKKGGYTVPSGHRIIATINAAIDSGASGDRVLLDPLGLDTGYVVHEMLHSYGLNHSWSNDTGAGSSGQPGEYDNRWDEMSAMRIHGFTTNGFGRGPVGLNGYHRDKLGWLDQSRIVTVGADGVGVRDILLTSLDEPGTAGTKLVRVPVDANNPDHYFTVEYRRPVGWSRGIPGDQVLISEVKDGKSYLLRDPAAPGRAPWSWLDWQGAKISVTFSGGATALVHIESNIVEQCKPGSGYVWRDAGPNDHVCVTTTVRSQAQADNAAAPSRWVNGAYGAHTCTAGYVWREAFWGDDVCVTTARRDQAKADNAAAISRRVPRDFAVQGPNRCKSGYSWRQADARDYVCVGSSSLSARASDNAAAASRWAASSPVGARPCKSGYVWREAFPGDDVCVSVSRRSTTASENRTARDRVANPNA